VNRAPLLGLPRSRPARLAAASTFLAAAVALGIGGCGAGGIEAQDRPDVVSTFPAQGAVLPGWLAGVRFTLDEPVRVLNKKAVAVWVNGDAIDANVIEDPSDPRSVLVVTEGGRFTPGFEHRVSLLEGAVVNSRDHYLYNEFAITFTLGPRPHVFVGTSAGELRELVAADGTLVATTAVPVGYLAKQVLGADDEVFAWLDKTGVGDDLLAYFVPGAGSTTTIPLAGETGERVALGLALSIDGRTLYATTADRGTNTMRVHRIDTATRAELAPSLVLATSVAGSTFVARRPAIDTLRNRLYVAQDDGAGGGTLSVVDLATFTEVDVRPGAGTSSVLADGAGDLTFGIDTDRLWMTIADEPNAGLVVIDPVSFATYEAREQEFTLGPIASALTPDERYFLQGLDGYAGLTGLVRSSTFEIGDGFGFDVRDDVGGTLQGSSSVRAIVADPGSSVMLLFATGSGKTILTAYEWLDESVSQLDLDFGVDGVQGVSLATSAPGDVLCATFLAGAHAP
jgi:hypothetical protein